MRRLALPIALVAVLALPQAAGAAVRQIIRGAGFGHGVGMSQYGAYGYARHGYDYKFILGHYYQGSDLTSAGQSPIRVLLQSGSRSATVTGATAGGGHKLNPAKTYTVRLNGLGGEVLLDSKHKQIGHYNVPLSLTSSTGLLRLNGRAINGVTAGHYRGSLEFRPSPFSGLAVVNVVSLDDYVKGVVPGEMPASWSAEALKAQAVAARSYALATDAGGPVFDQYPDTRSQMYVGADGEQQTSNAAVDATAGQVLRYQGKVIPAYFFSTSGGETEDVQNVFYGLTPVQFLSGVKDPYDGLSPRHRWSFTMSTATLQRRLGSLVKGKLRGIRVTQRGVSPRIVWASVVGTRGSVQVRGDTLKARLGLYDTWATFNRFSSKSKPRTPAKPVPSTPGGGVQASRIVRVPKQFELPARHMTPAKPGRVFGSIWPAPRHRAALVQKLGRDGHWHTVGHTRLSKGGGYNVAVRGTGTFRVALGALVGPSVIVR